MGGRIRWTREELAMTSRFAAVVVAALGAVVFVAPRGALADVITTTDGIRLEGDLKREGDNWIVTTRSGIRTVIPASKVKSIEASKPAAKPSGTSMPGAAAAASSTESPADRLAALRRSAEGLSDIHQILDRYQAFIAQAKGTAV